MFSGRVECGVDGVADHAFEVQWSRTVAVKEFDIVEMTLPESSRRWIRTGTQSGIALMLAMTSEWRLQLFSASRLQGYEPDCRYDGLRRNSFTILQQS
jgi:hypothetical protein